MVFYWQGRLPIYDTDGFVNKFFESALPELRAHAIRFVGRALGDEENTVPSEIGERLRLLWEHRLAAASNSETAEERVELVDFGWWFVSRKFDAAWSIDQLHKGLSLAGWAEPDHEVVEQLDALATQFPLKAIQCLTLMVDGDKNGWGISSWNEHARRILVAARDSTEDRAKEAAKTLINRLAARGIMEFIDLL